MPASRDLIRWIVLDYGFRDGYLDRPREDTDDDEDLDDDPPKLETDLALLTAGELSLEALMPQNPNVMILFHRQGGERLLPELGYDDHCAQFFPGPGAGRSWTTSPDLRVRLAYQLDHWDCRRREHAYRWVSAAEGWALADAGKLFGALTNRGHGSAFPFPQ
jgi:hypothetical protein